MRVAVVSESFLPQVNGVTNSVLRTIEHLEQHGHTGLVIAPGPGPVLHGQVQVLRSPSIPLPGYADFRLSRPWSGLRKVLQEFQPDIVHLASPAILGAQAVSVAKDLGIPSVAVYQTDLAGFAVRRCRHLRTLDATSNSPLPISTPRWSSRSPGNRSGQ